MSRCRSRGSPQLLESAAAQIGAAVPGVRIMPFGHLGDGNIHYNMLQPQAMAGEAFLAMKEQVQRQVFDLVTALDGSISAEHGIGRSKRPSSPCASHRSSWPLMRQIKRTLDPTGILNPGAVL